MSDLFERFSSNPLLRPEQVRPSSPDLEVHCLLNPGAFRYGGRTWLLLRVAERPPQRAGFIRTAVLDSTDKAKVLEFDRSDPALAATDPRVFNYKDQAYLTTLSHLRLAWSDDGIRFFVDDAPTLVGCGDLETFGIEDCRVTTIDDLFCLTYTAVSPAGVGVALTTTRDWRRFDRHGLILPPHNKDCAIFPERIGGHFYALHRPSGAGLGGNFIWISRSPDLRHWGEHRCIAMTRPGAWDSARIGAGAAPIATDAGWLVLYHGADHSDRYCLGTMLLDRNHPERVLARCTAPVMEPAADYETAGFFGNVVFTNGHVLDGNRLTIYYGASDQYVCGAVTSVSTLLEGLGARK